LAHDMAPRQERLSQDAFWIVVAGKGAPGQDAGLRPQVIKMPVAGGGAMHMAVQAGGQTAFGTAGIEVIAAWKSERAQSANRGLAGGAEPQDDNVRAALGGGDSVKRPA
jgi:hypothetical protein